MAFKDLMGRTETNEVIRPGPTPSPGTAAQTQPPASSGSTTYIDSSTVVEGKLKCTDSLRIDGKVKGAIECAVKVAVGYSGKVKATIEADSVVVAGEVNGDITARSKVTIEKTGRVTGNLCTPGIVIQEGAKLEGRITIGEDSVVPSKPAPKAGSAKTGSPKPEAKRPSKDVATPSVSV